MPGSISPGNKPLSGLSDSPSTATLRARIFRPPQTPAHWVPMVAMKVRSCVLVACMLVVPALALFSHLTPPAAREFMRCIVCDPLCRAITAIDAALPFGSQATISGGLPKPSAKPSASTAPLVAIADEPVSPTTPPPPSGGGVPAIEAAFTEALPPVMISETAEPASPSAEHDMPRSQAEWARLATLRKQLATLGASGIDCRPQPGAVPGYASSCRIIIDANGQLHRMFHGQGPDATAAMQSLVNQIQAWQIQQAGGPRQRF